jgi:DNA-binding response OmpR family regulator
MGVAVQLKTVLIVDEDLGFVFWLGHLLNSAGYQVWPARNGEDAAALMEELGAELDLLIIDPNLRGAAAFLETQRNSRDFHTIALERRQEWVGPLAGIDIALAKPPHPDELSGLEWITAIRNLLSSDS